MNRHGHDENCEVCGGDCTRDNCRYACHCTFPATNCPECGYCTLCTEGECACYGD